MIKKNFDDLDTIIKMCRKGYFIYLVVNNNKLWNDVKKYLISKKISYKRGIFTYKGIIILSKGFRDKFELYFDYTFEIIK